MGRRNSITFLLVIAFLIGGSFAIAQESGAPGAASPREAWENARPIVEARNWSMLWDMCSQETQEEFMSDIIREKRRWRKKDETRTEKESGKTYGELLEMSWKELWVTLLSATFDTSKAEIDTSIWVFSREKIRGRKAEVEFEISPGQVIGMGFYRDKTGWKLAGMDFIRHVIPRPGSNQSSAQVGLKVICTGSEQFKSSTVVDANANGIGEYGFLAEMGGTKPCRAGGQQFESSPYIPRVLGTVNELGVAMKSGYCFILYLPTGLDGATATDMQMVDAALAQDHYIAYAWPQVAGKTGEMEYLITPSGLVYSRKALHSGRGNPPGWNDAFTGKDGKNWRGEIDESRWKVPGRDEDDDWGEEAEEEEKPSRERPEADPSMTVEKAEKIFREFYGRVLEGVRSGSPVGSEEADAVAKAHGFKDFADFCTVAAVSLGAEAWQKLVKKTTDWFQEEVKKVTEEKAGKPEKPEDK
ncbi:MAG: hypothetical protein ACYTFG_15820 [Planctomycetota bacterium]|jgi:hypothetical protein